MPTRIEPFYRELGLRLQQLRSEKKLSQQQLASALEPQVTRASIANIETGKQRVLAHTLVQIASVLDVPVGVLFPPTTKNAQPENEQVAAEIAEKLPSLSAERVQAFVAKLKI